MLNFNFLLLEQFLLLEKVIFLIVEDVIVFVKVVKWFYQYSEFYELKLFNDKYKELKELDLLIIIDVLGFDINLVLILKLIYVDLECQFNEKVEVKLMIDKLIVIISELIGYELLDYEFDLEGDEIMVLELFKVLGIKIEIRSDIIFEKLFELFQVYKYLFKKKLLVLINVCFYFMEEEISEV